MVDLKVVEIPALCDMEKMKIESNNLSGMKSFKYGESLVVFRDLL